MLKTAGSEVDDLDFGMERMPQQNILGFQVTVNDFALLEQNK